MKKTTRAAAIAALALLAPIAANAGPIERACLSSDRSAANRQVCACIQQVADMTLRGGDQRRAAKFFADPDSAQEMRVSRSANDSAFWQRYRNFGSTAEAYCAR